MFFGVTDLPTAPDPWTWTQPVQTTWVQRCPICEGRGTVPRGFKRALELKGRQKCQTCDGRGMLKVSSFGTVNKLNSWELG